MSRGLICGVYLFHSWLDIWVRINVSQSELVNLYTWECLHGRRCGQVWDTRSTTTETRETALIEEEGGEKKKKEKHHMWTSSPAVIQHHEILYFPFPCRNMSRQVLTNWRPRNRKWNTHSARFLINSTSRCPSLCCQKWLQSTFNMCDFILVSMALCFFFFLLKGT